MTKNLPDYPAIKKLASALFKLDASQHGTAIMIGAGFSRSAAQHVSGPKKMSLWKDFSKRLVAELNPNATDLSFSDPLRVAEEYRAYFGTSTLNDRIRSDIDDEAWRPSGLYKSLLELPWSEVLTTNWDTLLERAAKDIHGPYYTPVTKPSDLAWAPSPRIVKLHGTIGVTETFIAAQEDFRTYPENFAPFVNFARHVFIENELCLLGFSGDDPNFLQWAGWVRDHLAGNARKIYLVGALNLTPARRKHLESLNVSPIDLWDLVKTIDDQDHRHQKATELFLDALRETKHSIPTREKWRPNNSSLSQIQFSRKNAEQDAALLLKELGTLQADRKSYPDWLVCPPELRGQVSYLLNGAYVTPPIIEALKPDDQATLLYEVAWRHDITFKYIPSWLAEALFHIADPDKPCALTKGQRLEINLVLLKNSRWAEATDETQPLDTSTFVNSLESRLEKYAEYLPDCAAELAYHRALVSRDSFDYQCLENIVESIKGEDPVWKLRQAALLMELGRFDEGGQLVGEAYGLLRDNYRRDRYSIYTLSRLTWAHWLLKAAREYTTDQQPEELPPFAEGVYRKWKCDPWIWIESIRDKAIDRQDKYIKNKYKIKPSFKQGYYQVNSNNTLGDEDRFRLSQFDGLTRSVGIPLFSGNVSLKVNLLSGTAEKLLPPCNSGFTLSNYTLAIRAASQAVSPSIEENFTRIDVASAPIEAAQTLAERILVAVNFWQNKQLAGSQEQKTHALSALSPLISVLARLVIRLPTEKAKQIFKLSVSLAQQNTLFNYQLFEGIESLLEFSLTSVPKSEQGELLADALVFPLQKEVMDRDFPRLPNPVIKHINARDTYPNLTKRIDELIEAVTPNGSVSGSSAIFRLLPMVEKNGFLTKNERDKLTSTLWGSTPEYKALPNILNIFPHTFLILPAPNPQQVKALVCRHLYEQGKESLTNTHQKLRRFPSPEIHEALLIYEGIANAAAYHSMHLLPTRKQALSMFDDLINWRPYVEALDSFSFESDNRKALTKSIGNTLSYAVVPALPRKDRTIERFHFFKKFYEEISDIFSAMPVFVLFAELNEDTANVAEVIIRKSLQGRDVEEVSYAAFALKKWIGLSKSVNYQLKRLIEIVIIIIESGRMAGLQNVLLVVHELYKKQWLSKEQISTLIEVIPSNFYALEYMNIDPLSEEAVSASSIRVEYVRLAHLLIADHTNEAPLQELLEKAREDALPEVRFALDSIDD